MTITKKHNIIKNPLFLLLFTFLCCEKKSSNVIKLTHQDGIQKIIVEIENRQPFLMYKKPTKVNITIENIEENQFLAYCYGMKILSAKDGVLKTEITVPKSSYILDTLIINVRYGKDRKKFEFKIPVKSDI